MAPQSQASLKKATKADLLDEREPWALKSWAKTRMVKPMIWASRIRAS